MATITLETKNDTNSFVVYVGGEIDLNTVDQLEEAIKEGLDLKKDIAIDMNDVRFIDSTGIGLLVQTYKKLNQEDKKITVLNAKENVRKVFKITCLEDTFNMGV